MLKLTTNRHEASRSLPAKSELLVLNIYSTKKTEDTEVLGK